MDLIGIRGHIGLGSCWCIVMAVKSLMHDGMGLVIDRCKGCEHVLHLHTSCHTSGEVLETSAERKLISNNHITLPLIVTLTHANS